MKPYSQTPADVDSHSRSHPQNPPRAPLAFRVGVVGHRPDRLKDADLKVLSKTLQTILSTVKGEVLNIRETCHNIYDKNSSPVLRALSPLAEGTDRLFAREALDLQYDLCCVLPFSRAEFEKDFAPGKALEKDSLAQFNELAGRATTLFELDGSRDNEAAAYGVCGDTVLNQSDLLIVVWDGVLQGKRGGTEETFDEARRHGVPVAWIDAQAPHTWQVLSAGAPLPHFTSERRAVPDGTNALESLQQTIVSALILPRTGQASSKKHSHSNEEPHANLHSYYAESQPRRTIAVVWKAFRDIVGDGKLPKISFSIPPFEETLKKEWPEIAESKPHNSPASPVASMVDWLRPFYAWPDKLAVVYSDRYRSAFILAFFLAALAVGAALLPVGLRFEEHGWAETVSIAFEITAILTILFLVFKGRKQQWHERWINYRLTAELIRHLRLVAPLGGGRPLPPIPAHWLSYGHPTSTWMAWYVRAIERALGLPSVAVDKNHLNDCLNHLGHLVKDQIKFHETSARRSEQIEKRLHRWGISLLGLSVLCGAAHISPAFCHQIDFPKWLPPFLTFYCGFLPALGAALAGIFNQGEFRRIAKRSEAMHEQLEALGKQIASLQHQINQPSASTSRQFSAHASALTNDAARLLVHEVLDWRVVFLDQPLVPPA